MLIPGREIVQVLTEIPCGVESGWHIHPGEEVGYIVAGTVEMMIRGRADAHAARRRRVPDHATHAAQRTRRRPRHRPHALHLHRRDRTSRPRRSSTPRDVAPLDPPHVRTKEPLMPETNNPLTVVLVHGAFADASSWNGVIDRCRPTASPWSLRRTRSAASPRLRLHRQRVRPDPRPGARRRALLRRRGHHERRDGAENVVGLVYRRGLRPGRR